MRKFKGSLLIVVETPYQPRVLDILNRDGIQNLFNLLVVLAAILIQILRDCRESCNDRLVFRNFAIEDSQRMGHGAPLAIDAHLIYYGSEGLPQRLIESGAVGGAAHRIQLQRPVGDADAVEQRGDKFENLRVSRRRLTARTGRADDFGIDLVELPVSSFLRSFAAKHWADRENFIQPPLPEFVLDVGAHDASCVFGTK